MKETIYHSDQPSENDDNLLPHFNHSDERAAKVELAFKINELLKKRNLKQVESVKILGVDKAQLSLLHHGRVSAFTIEQLIKFLNLLNQDVEIVIRRIRQRSHQGSLRVVQV